MGRITRETDSMGGEGNLRDRQHGGGGNLRDRQHGGGRITTDSMGGGVMGRGE